MTDNSFKLFAADPTPGHDPKKLIAPSRSTNDLATTPARDFLTEDEGKGKGHSVDDKKGEKKDENREEKGEEKKEEKKDEPHKQPHTKSHGTTGTSEKKETIKGPWRILRLLPRESRNIVSRMLDINPKTRARMDEILQEPWVADTVICQQFDDGVVIPAEDHTHVLEPPASQQPAGDTKKV